MGQTTRIQEDIMLFMLTLCLFLHFAQAASGVGRYCDTNQDCGRGQCCISFITPRGKRDVANPRTSTQGKCQKLGTIGSGCLVQQTAADLFYQSCPCKSGFTCVGNGVITLPLGEQGVCKVQREPTPCWTVSDCKRNECCVSNTRPIRKRSAERKKRQSAPGRCERLGKLGADCLVKNGSGRPTANVFVSCPCIGGLDCQSTGVMDIPLGYLGTCATP